MSEKKTIVLEDLNADEASNLLGTQDRNLNVLAQSFGYTIYYRDNVFTIEDCPDEVAQKIEEVLHALLKQAERGISITEQDVIYASRAVQHNEPVDFEEFSLEQQVQLYDLAQFSFLFLHFSLQDIFSLY